MSPPIGDAMPILLLTFFGCKEKPVEDSGFFDIVIESSNDDTEDTEEKEDTAIEEPEPDTSDLTLIGIYTDDTLVTHTITEELWDAGPERMFTISQFDNLSGFLIAKMEPATIHSSVTLKKWNNSMMVQH